MQAGPTPIVALAISRGRRIDRCCSEIGGTIAVIDRKARTARADADRFQVPGLVRGILARQHDC